MRTVRRQGLTFVSRSRMACASSIWGRDRCPTSGKSKVFTSIRLWPIRVRLNCPHGGVDSGGFYPKGMNGTLKST